MATLPQNATWIDINSNYHILAQSELSLDIDAITNSIENILSTPIGSRPFEREYGSKLYYFVHEPIDRITEEDIRVSLIQALEKWEPRIVIDMQQTTVTRLLDNSGYSVNLYFTMIVPKLPGSATFVIKRIQQ